jgi:desulfoferrodoxin-like iron-binding protein
MKKGQVYKCPKCGNTVEVVNVGGGTLVCCDVPMNKIPERAKDSVPPHVILGVHITDRVKHAAGVQGVLTDFGCNIKTRLGLHEVQADVCSPNGLMLLEFCGAEAQCEDLEARLAAVEGIEVKRMIFDHP